MTDCVRQAQGILDTSTLILLPRMNDAGMLPVEALITAVTLAELSVGPLVALTDKDRADRQAHLQQAEADFSPLPFDASAAHLRTAFRCTPAIQMTSPALTVSW